MTTRATQHSTIGDPPGSGRRADWTALAGGAVLAAWAIAVYSNTFSVPLLYDDTQTIVDNPTIRHLQTVLVPPNNTTASGRPILNLSLAVNYAVSGAAVWSYHAANLAIHVLAGLTLFGIIRRTLAPRTGAAAPVIAFSAAVLWALHPLQTEAVTYIVQRAESLMGLFYLLTLYCFIRGVKAEGRSQSLWLALCAASCALGMGTKEVMASAPLIVLLYDRTFVAGTFRDALRLRWRVYGALASTWLVLAYLVVSTHGRGGTAGSGSGVVWWRYALTQFEAITHYLRLCFWPHPLIFDYGTALVRPSIGILPYALVIVALMALILWALVKLPAAGFLGASFFAILAPSSSIVPVATQTLAEHRMYLPLIPVVVLAVVGVHRWLGRGALPLFLALAAALSWATWRRNEDYRSIEAIWSDTVAKLPENERAQYNLGCFLQNSPGRLGEAVARYEEALRLKPGYCEAHNNLGNALSSMGRTREAIDHHEEALRLKPDYFEARYNLGNELMREGRIDEALAQFRKSLELQPRNASAHTNLGDALLQLGRTEEAFEHYGKAVEIDPGDATARNNLGAALLQVGRPDEAIPQLQKALEVNPGFAKARVNLGSALLRKGRLDEAVAQFNSALAVDPANPGTLTDLGTAYAQKGQLEQAAARFQEALKTNPDFATALTDLANVLLQMGRRDEAIARYHEALRADPNSAAAHNNLAYALRQAGRLEEAIAHCRKALELSPDYPEARRNLEAALLEKSRMDGAGAH